MPDHQTLGADEIFAMTPRRNPARTLRDWLDRLARQQRLAIAQPGTGLQFKLAGISKRLESQSAVLFPEPDGHPIPVVSNLLINRHWVADAMDVDVADVLEVYRYAATHPLPWREVNASPAYEITHRDIDLTRILPIPVHNEHDSGPYISAGLMITRNPKTGTQNVAIHRCQVSNRNQLGVLLLPRHTNAFFEAAEAAGEPLEAAIVIGIDPLTLLASQAIAPIDQDEIEIAGALHGAPVEVVRCRGKNIHVPAASEIILEGRLLANTRAPEGPFGEFPQYYGLRADRHVFEVDLIAHRKDAIFHTIVGGGMEHLILGAIPREATILQYLRFNFPNVLDVHLPRGGVCRYHAYVRIKKKRQGEAKNIILATMSAHYDIKHVTVVDEDVDIHDPTEVEWAVATRFQGDRDLVVIPHSQCSNLDPSTDSGVGAKMGFDATVPTDVDPMRYKRIRVLGEAEIDLSEAIVERKATEWRDAIKQKS